jgi:ribosomal protein S12 methylthiotransferase accessory factor
MPLDAGRIGAASDLMDAITCALPKGERDDPACATANRSVPPAETLARFLGPWRAMGVTRIGNVTGLDDIGIPIFIAVRPLSRSVTVAMGKGLTPAHSRASALMEAAEQFHGEAIAHRFVRASERELASGGALFVSPDELCRTAVPYDPEQPIDWIEGIDLDAGRACSVPAASVHAEHRGPGAVGDALLVGGSNGLASGNHVLEAIVAGICELIERDAVALWHARGLLARAACRLDLDSVDDPACRALLGRYATAGADVQVWDVTSDLGVPVFICDITPTPNGHAPFLRRFRGAGCHPEPAAALARALTEAAQSRLNRIVGLRNDLDAEGYVETAETALGGALLDAMSDAATPREFAAATRFASDDVGEDARWLLARLASCDFARVVAVDLTRPAFGIPVVRMVIPSLEWDGDHPGYRPGARATRVMAGAA